MKKKPNLADILGRPDTARDFKALNPHLHEAIKPPTPASKEPRAHAFSPQPEPGSPKPPKPKKMSSGEIYMAAWLSKQVQEGKIATCDFEAITLKLGDNRCEYTPDFFVRRHEGKPLLIEVKGKKKWEDSLVKFKTARTIWGWLFDFEMWEFSALDGWRQLYT